MATFLKSLLEVSKLSLIEVILFADTTNIGNGGGGVTRPRYRKECTWAQFHG